MGEPVYALARLLLPLLFVIEGVETLANVGGIVRMIQDSPVPVPVQLDVLGVSRFVILGYLAAVVEVVFGLMVMVGYRARMAALVLAAFTVCTIVVADPFWLMQGEIRALNLTQALKNLSIISGLLMIAVLGPGPFSLDKRKR